jgi:hypothetical protein
MERGFNFDFSKVRIHADAEAERRASALSARAFTVGRDISFGAGQYRPETLEGAQLLAHELAHVVEQARTGRKALQLARLRDWQHDRAAAVSDADIRTTNEFRRYMDPTLVWQIRDHVTDREAIQACRYMLAAMRNGQSINWARDARTYLNRARIHLGAVSALATEQSTWLAAQAAAAGQSPGEFVHSVAQAGGYGGGPAPWWDGLSPADRAAWMSRATTVIAAVVSSVHGTPLEAMVRARGIVASPRQCETMSAYAYFSSSDNRLHVGREWIDRASADPRNVHDNIAHELGGHFEYGQYGPEMARAIMERVLDSMPPADRARATAGPRHIYTAYGYPETEIFAELREFGLRRAGSGGDPPPTDVPRQLRNIRDRFAPIVARSIVLELRQRVREANNITAAAKALFDTSVNSVFPGLIPP